MTFVGAPELVLDVNFTCGFSEYFSHNILLSYSTFEFFLGRNRIITLLFTLIRASEIDLVSAKDLGLLIIGN